MGPPRRGEGPRLGVPSHGACRSLDRLESKLFSRRSGPALSGASNASTLAIPVSRATAHQARAPGVRRARDAGAGALAVLPLRDAEGTLGYAALAIAAATPATPLSPALLDAVARVLTGALRQVQLLGRV